MSTLLAEVCAVNEGHWNKEVGMFCSRCGTENPDDGSFCMKCGAGLGTSESGGAAPAKAGTGLESNVAGLLCYVLGWLTGLIFFLIEKEDRFVRFHAMQSIVVFGGLSVLSIATSIISWIPYLGWLIFLVWILVGPVAFILWIVLMVKAYQGQMFKVPWAGDFAERHI